MNFLKLFTSQTTTRPTISRPIVGSPATSQSSNFDVEKHNHIRNVSNDLDDDLKPTFYDNTLPPCPPPRPRINIILSALHISSTLLSLTAIALLSATIPIWDRNFMHTASPIKGDWTDGLILAPLSLTCISSLYLAYTSLRSRRRQQDHISTSNEKPDKAITTSSPNQPPHDPFYTILLSLTFLIILIPTIILSATNSFFQIYQHIQKPTSSISTSTIPQKCTLPNLLTKPCLPIIYKIGDLQIAFLSITTIIAIYWLVILGWSIKMFTVEKAEEKRRREERRVARRQRRRERHEKEVKYGRDRGDHGGRRSERNGGSDHSKGSRSVGDDSHTTRTGSTRSQRLARAQISSNSKRVKEWEGSNAVRLAQHSVAPKETIQQWLACRQA